MTPNARRAIVSLLMMLTIVGCAAATTAPPLAPPKTQEAASKAVGPMTDPVLGITAVQVVLIAAAITALAGLTGVLVGGGVTYFVQWRLDKWRRAEVEKRLAYALLVQVTSLAAATKAALDQVGPLGKVLVPQLNVEMREAIEQGVTTPQAAWCAILAKGVERDPQLRALMKGLIGPFVGSISVFNETLSAMQLRGKDFADFPPSALAAHSRAKKELASCEGAFKSVAGVLADESMGSDPLDRMALVTWESMKRVAQALEELRLSLIETAGITEETAAKMHFQGALEGSAALTASRKLTESLDRARRYVKWPITP